MLHVTALRRLGIAVCERSACARLQRKEHAPALINAGSVDKVARTRGLVSLVTERRFDLELGRARACMPPALGVTCKRAYTGTHTNTHPTRLTRQRVIDRSWGRAYRSQCTVFNIVSADLIS
jgi:hypothetical protein